MKRISIAVVLLSAALAHAVPYPIVAVRAPRLLDKFTSWPEVSDPCNGEPGSHLVIIKPDGTEEILVDAGPDGMVMDPSPSLDGQWVYYAYVSNQRATNNQIRPRITIGGADIWKVNVATREKVRLTNQEWTPATGVAKWYRDPATGRFNPIGIGSAVPTGESVLTYGIYNTGPCEVPGGRVIFTSSRNGYLAPKGASFPNMQLYAMDTDGKNVEQVGYLNIASALHPTLLKSGEIMWSSWESQGTRSQLLWGVWTSRPDGSEWNPAFSAFAKMHSMHFQTQQPDGKIAVVGYYNLNNFGFGTIFRFPHQPTPPADLHAFHSPLWSENPVLRRAYADTFVQAAATGYSPWGIEVVTSFCNEFDFPASPLSKPGNERYGKVTHPAAGPDGLLMVYSPGPVNSVQPPYLPPPQGKIAWLPYDKSAVENPSSITILKENPQYNYQQPRPLLSWQEIYSSNPIELPWCPNDGKSHAKLPRGTPFGIVGTSSVYNRNSVTNGSADGFNHIVHQGGDVGTYKNSDIHAIRLVQTLPQSHRGWTVPQGPHSVTVGWHQGGVKHLRPNERLKIIGEIPLRKNGPDGKPILDAKGDPDTSFQARIPADVPFTFQLLDEKGKALVQSQTWHQLRPGERRVNCGGCHAHSESPVDFNFTEAAKSNYVIADLLGKPRDVEWNRDVKSIVETECKTCHTTNATAKAKMDLTDSLAGFELKCNTLQARISPTILAAEGALPHVAIAAAKVRTLAEWIDLGMLIDEGGGKAFLDNINPTLTVQSPAKGEAASTIIFGAFDNESGIAPDTISVKLDGTDITDKFTQNGQVASYTLPSPKQSGRLVVSIKDNQGNLAVVDRTFNGTTTPEPPPRIPVAIYMGRDADKLGDLRSKTPDGKLDHHFRVTGLKYPISHVNIHDGAVKWSDMAGEESPTNPQGTWWFVMTNPPLPGGQDGVQDIYISDRGTPGQFILFPIYSDNSFDRLEAFAPTDPCEEIRKQIAELQRKIDAAKAALE
jgi:hypothetical protein